MDAKTLIPLPAFEDVVRSAVTFLTQGEDVAVVGPPGCGVTTLGLSTQEQLVTNGVPAVIFDCRANGDFSERLKVLQIPKPNVAVRNKGRKALADIFFKIGSAIDGGELQTVQKVNLPKRPVIILDHASSLPGDSLKVLLERLSQVVRNGSVRLLWLGALDARNIKAANGIEIHTDIRTHLCLPETGRDDLLRLYRAILVRQDRRWGEAMLYFALDWCGNDLALANQLVEHFYGDWTERIYDDAVGECLADWLAKSSVISGYRRRFAALPDPCKEQLRLLCGGGKLVSHRPEVHLETCDKMRRLFLDGFLCANLLPGYYQFRHLAARVVVLESMGIKIEPLEHLRRAANARVNLLLQDIEVSLRVMLSTVFRQMPIDEVKKLLKSIPSQQRLMDEDFQPKLMDWGGQQTQPGQGDLRAAMGQFLGQEGAKFKASSNLWSEVCRVFRDSYGLENASSEPTSEQAVSCLTFNQLKDLIQKQSNKLFLDKPRSKRLGEPPSKRWPNYLTRVRRLRNDSAHLRNISFQDVEDLLKDLDQIRQDQLDFGIIP